MSRVLLDLNDPQFQDQLLGLDAAEYKLVAKTLRKLKQMEWEDVYRDHGLKWEGLKSAEGKYSIRLSVRSRAVVRREKDHVRFQAIHLDHDSTYGRK